MSAKWRIPWRFRVRLFRTTTSWKRSARVVWAKCTAHTTNIEQGRPAAAESPALEIAAEYHKQKSSLNEAAGLSTLAYSLLEQGKARNEAIAAVDRASELVAKSHQTELVMPD